MVAVVTVLLIVVVVVVIVARLSSKRHYFAEIAFRSPRAGVCQAYRKTSTKNRTAE